MSSPATESVRVKSDTGLLLIVIALVAVLLLGLMFYLFGMARPKEEDPCDLADFDFSQGVDYGTAADNIGSQISGTAADIARECCATKTCKGFNTDGWLRGAAATKVDREEWKGEPAKGFYMRK